MLSATQLAEVLPVIASLVLIEGLLSVDNALAIAALASHLPKEQQTTALRLGIIGAYVFRGLALLLVGLIIENPWIKLGGAAYLIYLMASHLAANQRGEHADDPAKQAATSRPRGLLATVLQIEAMDLALSLDNVVAAVALDPRLWLVCTGVFIGILVLRFLAGWSIRLLEKFPILNSTAFLLIGFVGVILTVEIVAEINGHHIRINSYQKFLGILVILGLSLLYARSAPARTILWPVVAAGTPLMTALDKIFGVVFWPVTKAVDVGKAAFTRETSDADGPNRS